MENIRLESWQTLVLITVYIAYLCWVMFGGLRRRKIKPTVYVVMTLLMIYGVVHEFTDVSSTAEAVNICIVLSVGAIKGIVLGKRKIVEKADGVWYMHHDKAYILLWVTFFAVKLLLTQVLGVIANTQFPMWHMILYFCFYYPWRTVNVFRNNPEMRKDVLSKSKTTG